MTKSEKRKIVAHLRKNEQECKADAAVSFRRAAQKLTDNADRAEVWAEVLDAIESMGESIGHGNAAADVEEEAWRP